MLASVSGAGASMLVFGGIDSKNSSKHNSVHVCDLKTLNWHALETREGPAPAARSDASPDFLACKRSCPSLRCRHWNVIPLSAAAGTAACCTSLGRALTKLVKVLDDSFKSRYLAK